MPKGGRRRERFKEEWPLRPCFSFLSLLRGPLLLQPGIFSQPDSLFPPRLLNLIIGILIPVPAHRPCERDSCAMLPAGDRCPRPPSLRPLRDRRVHRPLTSAARSGSATLRAGTLPPPRHCRQLHSLWHRQPYPERIPGTYFVTRYELRLFVLAPSLLPTEIIAGVSG